MLPLSCLSPLLAICTASVPANTVVATRVDRAPALGAMANDVVWRGVSPVSDFRQWAPREDAAPSLRTEFRVAYDRRYLYVVVRAFDPPTVSLAP